MVTVDYWDDLVSRSKPKPQTAPGDKMATNTKPAASKTTKPNLKVWDDGLQRISIQFI